MTGRKRSSTNNTAPSARDLEKALETLKALGWKVEFPTSAEEREKQESSVTRLGFTDAKRLREAKEQEERDSKTLLKATLGAAHYIGDKTYGPGPIELPRSQASLFRSLIHQDALSRQAHLDTAQYQPIANCYLIKPGSGSDTKNKFSKIQVSEAVFNSERLWEEVAVTSGQHDIAGFNPNFNAENRSF